jgi:hypothetical protein
MWRLFTHKHFRLFFSSEIDLLTFTAGIAIFAASACAGCLVLAAAFGFADFAFGISLYLALT